MKVSSFFDWQALPGHISVWIPLAQRHQREAGGIPGKGNFLMISTRYVRNWTGFLLLLARCKVHCPCHGWRSIGLAGWAELAREVGQGPQEDGKVAEGARGEDLHPREVVSAQAESQAGGLGQLLREGLHLSVQRTGAGNEKKNVMPHNSKRLWIWWMCFRGGNWRRNGPGSVTTPTREIRTWRYSR